MIKWIPAIVMVLMLSACGSSVQPTYYQLPLADTAVSARLSSAPESRPAVWVDQVTTSDVLSGNGVVYQTSPVKFVMAARHQWASPLDQQLKQTLISELSTQLPGRVVSATPLGEHPDILSVNVTGFQGRYDGKVLVSGDWVLQRNGGIERHSFAVMLPQREDGYDDLVITLGKGWQQVSEQIARQLARTASANVNY